jgi:hypothetical protein
MRIFSVLSIAALSFWSGFPTTGGAGSIGYSYTLIVDTTGTFDSFVPAPALNAAGTVAFAGTERGQQQGIYTGSGGSITRIALGYYYEDPLVTIDDSVSSVPSINATGNVAWIEWSYVSHASQSTGQFSPAFVFSKSARSCLKS